LTALKTITVTGAAGLTDSSLFNTGQLAALTSVTSTSSGAVTVSLDDTKTSFTGGSGQDIVTVSAAGTKAITGGSATNNELVYAGLGTGASFADFTKFAVLGVNSTSSGTFNLSTLTGFSSLDAQAGTGTVAFSNVAANTALAIDGAATSITYATSDTTGAGDTLTLALGGSSTNGVVTVGALIATDSSNTTGIGTVNITTNDTSTSASYTITALTDPNLSSLNLTGTGALAIGSTLNDTVSTLSITNNSTNSQASTIATLADNALSTLNVSGSGATTIATALTDIVPSLTIANNATALFTVASLNDNSLSTLNVTGSGRTTISALVDASSLFTLTDGATAAVNFTASPGASAVTVNNTGSALLTAALTDASATTESVTNSGAGSIALSIAGDILATAENVTNTGSGSITVSSLADTSATTESFTNSGTGSITIASHTDTAVAGVTLGGAVTYTAIGDTVSNGVTVNGGTDNNAVSLTLSGATTNKTDNITLGNGTNVVSDTGIGTVNITVGTGANTITLGAGTNTVVFGAHSATTVDAVSVTAATAPEAAAVVPEATISGLNATGADTIKFTDSGAIAVPLTTFSATALVTLGNTALAPTSLSAALSDVLGSGGGITTGKLAQHGIGEFVFGSNTYLIQHASSGTVFAATDTLVELTGTAYTFSGAATGASNITSAGLLHLVG
jgi:S-layer protein